MIYTSTLWAMRAVLAPSTALNIPAVPPLAQASAVVSVDRAPVLIS
ncbi:hypothetical protein AAHI00_14180 [Mycobacterium kansasii]